MSTNKSRTWWLIGAGWALLLLGLGVWSSMHSPTTIRDQSPVSVGKKTIDRVVAEVRGNVPAGWLLDDGGYQESPCEITPWRDGTLAKRTLTLSGPTGTEGDTLTKLASNFDDPRIKPGESFYADAGDYVSARARINGTGVVALQLSTDCRPND